MDIQWKTSVVGWHKSLSRPRKQRKHVWKGEKCDKTPRRNMHRRIFTYKPRLLYTQKMERDGMKNESSWEGDESWKQAYWSGRVLFWRWEKVLSVGGVERVSHKERRGVYDGRRDGEEWGGKGEAAEEGRGTVGNQPSKSIASVSEGTDLRNWWNWKAFSEKWKMWNRKRSSIDNYSVSGVMKYPRRLKQWKWLENELCKV